MPTGTFKSELSAARRALVSTVPIAQRAARQVQSENATLREDNERFQADNTRLQAENKRLRTENTHLVGESLKLKEENAALVKENVNLCARLNRPAFLMPRKGRLPPREEDLGRVVEMDDEPEDEPVAEPVPEPESVSGREGQKLVKVTRKPK